MKPRVFSRKNLVRNGCFGRVRGCVIREWCASWLRTATAAAPPRVCVSPLFVRAALVEARRADPRVALSEPR